MKVLILGGGDSLEREVSLRSARAVVEAARQAGFDVRDADPRDGFSILDSLDPATIVLPILHGQGGEDGSLQKELEDRRLAYLGSDSVSSANCFNKWQTRQMLLDAGVPMPEGELVTHKSYPDSPLAKAPHVLKVVRGGSSIGTLIVRDPHQREPARIEEIFTLDKQAVIERLIEGVETTVAVLDKTALTPVEISPPVNGEFDYQNKYNGQTQEICPPRNVPPAVQDQLKSWAEKVHQIMNCRHLSRVDIMLDRHNKPYVLEINTIPGLTDQSLFPKAAAEAGLTMSALVRRFVEMVKRDYQLT